MSGQPIAVIGASGQVARALQRAGAERAANLVVAGRPVIDLTRNASVAAFLDGIEPSIAINAAAYTAVDKAETEEAEAFRINRDGPHYLAKWCAAHAVPLLHISTDYVFDGCSRTPYSERDACHPVSAYGRSKAAGEDAVRDALSEHIIVRTAWVYSADGNNFLKTMLRLGAERDVIRVVADQYGTPTSADDIASALIDIAGCVLANRASAPWGTYHLVADGHTTWHGFAREIFAAAEVEGYKTPRVDAIPTADYPTPARRPQFGVLDTTEIRRAFGIALPPWQEGVAACVRRLTHHVQRAHQG
jgi:dTDP-4-dehydrorhamnose reductase